jgi:hypothetical protein
MHHPVAGRLLAAGSGHGMELHGGSWRLIDTIEATGLNEMAGRKVA